MASSSSLIERSGTLKVVCSTVVNPGFCSTMALNAAGRRRGEEGEKARIG